MIPMKQYTKKLLFMLAITLSVIASPHVASADSLQIYCNKFDDTWFTTMAFVPSGYCNPGTWGSLPITTAAAEFNASLSIALIGDGESIEKMDEMFRTDTVGSNIPFGSNRDVGDRHEEFTAVLMGSFATRRSTNSWEPVWSNTGKETGHRQNVSITYIIRQGKCYATLGVSGEGPLNSTLYYGILMEKASGEAKHIAETMVKIGTCGGATQPEVKTTPTTAPPAPSDNPDSVNISGNSNLVMRPKPTLTTTSRDVPTVPQSFDAPTNLDRAKDLETDDLPPASLQGYAEALAENAPTNDDVKLPPIPEKVKRPPLTAVVAELDGHADMKLADGTWVTLEVGSVIPNDAIVYTGYAATMLIRFSDHLIVILRSLSELSVKQFETDPSVYRTELKLESGELRFKVLEGTMKTDMKVSTPISTGAVTGTDFAVSYDKESGISVFEIYDHSVKVTSNATGEEKTISSSYGSPIRRIEVGSDGVMIEKIAVPKSEWEDFVAKNILEQNTAGGKEFFWTFLALIILAGGFLVYKNGLLNKIVPIKSDKSQP